MSTASQRAARENGRKGGRPVTTGPWSTETMRAYQAAYRAKRKAEAWAAFIADLPTTLPLLLATYVEKTISAKLRRRASNRATKERRKANGKYAAWLEASRAARAAYSKAYHEGRRARGSDS